MSVSKKRIGKRLESLIRKVNYSPKYFAAFIVNTKIGELSMQKGYFFVISTYLIQQPILPGRRFNYLGAGGNQLILLLL